MSSNFAELHTSAAAKIYSGQALGIKVALLSDGALDVVHTLNKAGFSAFIVGGSIRDLLLGKQPKDFDCVTDATPSDIKKVFQKRCRIIGKRFELAHVYAGRELIEVATFRSPPKQVQTNEAGMVTRDNVWGSIEQDYIRRDFSINAFYYHPLSDQLLDFCGGLQDMQARRICFLGKPLLRIQEDPVRMLRAVRFASKLDFALDNSIVSCLQPDITQQLQGVSSHRLWDELQKMLQSGHLLSLIPLLINNHLWRALFAEATPTINTFVEKAAFNTDSRLAQGKSINPAFFMAVMLWQPFMQMVTKLVDTGIHPSVAWTQAGIRVLAHQDECTAIPRFSQNFIREVWELQPRLTSPRSRQVPQLYLHPKFRAAFDFLLLREQAGDNSTMGMGAWWEIYQTLNRDQQEQAINNLNKQQQRQKKQKPAALGEDLMEQIAKTEPPRDKHGEMVLVADNALSKPRPYKTKQTASLSADIIRTTAAEQSDKISKTGTMPASRGGSERKFNPFTRRRRASDLDS